MAMLNVSNDELSAIRSAMRLRKIEMQTRISSMESSGMTGRRVRHKKAVSELDAVESLLKKVDKLLPSQKKRAS